MADPRREPTREELGLLRRWGWTLPDEGGWTRDPESGGSRRWETALRMIRRDEARGDLPPLPGHTSGTFPVVGVATPSREGPRKVRPSCSAETEAEIRAIFRHPPTPSTRRPCAYQWCPEEASEGDTLCLAHRADEVLP